MVRYIQTNEWRVIQYQTWAGKVTIGRLYECATRLQALVKARELYPKFDTVERVIRREEE